MFGSLFHKINFKRPLKHSLQNTQANHTHVSISKNLGNNIHFLREALGQSDDVIIREIKIGLNKKVDAAVIFIDGLVNIDLVNRDILTPLMFNLQLTDDNDIQNYSGLLNYIQTSVLTVGQISALSEVDGIIKKILSGNSILLVDGEAQALDINIRGWEKRAIEESPDEISLRGPKESFTETLRTNTALLRRKIRDPNLTFEHMSIGQRSQTDVLVTYINGIAPDNLIAEIKQRLERINTDAILDAGYIEQYIEDNPRSLFPTIGTTERPDVVTARILEGRAAILVDGSPMALTAPFLFIESFQNPDDYYALPFFASFVRGIRLLGFLLSVYLPGIFVSLKAFHPELFPTPLLITVAQAREGLPFPVALEAILMLILFEILREAGLRMPRSLGQAVSIVGALVIGQAAVSAGLVGAPMVIVVATTAIASFLAVNYADLGALFRFIMTIVAGFLGLLGIVVLSLEILSYLASLRSLGVPYLSPVTPLNIQGLKDTLLRAPLWAMDSRPVILDPVDKKRQSPGQMPQPAKTRNDKREDE